MLHFLNPIFLAALTAVGIPVLIHLIARRKAVPIPFSSIRFLKIIQRQEMRSMKLRQILLLVLRSVAVGFLVLSFTRPVLKSDAGWTRGQVPAAVAIVLDNSASMGRDALFEKAKNRTQLFLSTLKKNDRAALLRSVPDQKQDSVFSRFDPAILERGLNESVTLERGNCIQAVQKAGMLLHRSGQLNRELVLVSDMQATGFQRASDSSTAAPSMNRLFILPIQGETENAAVVRGGVENRILEPDAPVTVFAEVENFGTRKIEELLASVYLEDAKMSQKTVTLKAGEKRRLAFQIQPERGGWHWGSVRIDRDAFPQDDSRYFSFRVPEKIRVLLVGKTRSDILPLQTALVPGGQSGRVFDIRQSFYGEHWSGRLSGVDVAVFSNYPAFSSSETEALDAYLQNGGKLFLFFGKDVQLQHYPDRLFSDRFGIHFGKPAGQGGALSFGVVDYDHPIFQGVFEKGKEKIQSPQFYQFIPVSGGRLQPIVSLNNGLPLLSEVRTEKGALLLFAGGLDETWSDAAYTAVFAPMVYRSVLYLAGQEQQGEIGLNVGDPIRFHIPPDSLQGEYRVIIPSGEVVRLVPRVHGQTMVFDFDQTGAPGVYRFYRGDRLLAVRSVNMDPLESDFKTVSDRELKRLFPNTPIKTIQEGERIESAAAEARTGKELWKEMLLAAVILLMAEMAIAREWKIEQSE